jgi:hypothetical protein
VSEKLSTFMLFIENGKVMKQEGKDQFGLAV